MSVNIQFFGAAGEVTGSCHLLRMGNQKYPLDCGLVQGGRKDDTRPPVTLVHGEERSITSLCDC